MATGKLLLHSFTPWNLVFLVFSVLTRIRYCCGKGCEAPVVTETLFGPDPDMPEGGERKARAIPDAHIGQVDSLSTSDKARRKSPADIVAPKRAAPLSLLNKRGECKFSEESSEPETTYGEQVRIKQINECTSADGCQQSVTLSYSVMASNSWEAGAEIGGELFKAIGLSVNFGYTYEKSEEQGFETTQTVDTPKHQGGYMTFEPKLACEYFYYSTSRFMLTTDSGAKGKFEGDCEEWDSDKEGQACFVQVINGEPDGQFGFVAEL